MQRAFRPLLSNMLVCRLLTSCRQTTSAPSSPRKNAASEPCASATLRAVGGLKGGLLCVLCMCMRVYDSGECALLAAVANDDAGALRPPKPDRDRSSSSNGRSAVVPGAHQRRHVPADDAHLSGRGAVLLARRWKRRSCPSLAPSAAADAQGATVDADAAAIRAIQLAVLGRLVSVCLMSSRSGSGSPKQ